MQKTFQKVSMQKTFQKVSMMFVCSVYLSLSIMTLGIMTIGIMSVCPWQAKTMAKNILKGKYAKNI
jgi:hypothetical protein